MLTKNDLARKFRIVPGRETITFTPKTPNQKSFTVAGARFRSPSDPTEFGSGPVTATIDWCQWILPVANLGGYQPNAGDLITSDGTGVAPAGDWKLTQQTTSDLMQAEYKLHCVKAVSEA